MITARFEELTAVVTSPSSATARLSVPLYQNESLQSTLTHRDSTGGDVTLLKVSFSSKEHLCGLVKSDQNKMSVVVWNVSRGVVVHTIDEEEDIKIHDMATTSHDDHVLVLVSKKSSEKLYVQDYSLANQQLKMTLKIKAGKADDGEGVFQLAACGDHLVVRNHAALKVLHRETGKKVSKFKLSSEDGEGGLVMNDRYVVACTSSQVQVIKDGKAVTTVGISETPRQVQLQGSHLLVDASLYTIKKRASVVSKLEDAEVNVQLAFYSETEVQAVVEKGGAVELYRLPFITDDGTVVEELALPKEGDDDDVESVDAKRPAPSSVTVALGAGQAGAESQLASDRPFKRGRIMELEGDDEEGEDEEEAATIAERLKSLEAVLAKEDEDDDEVMTDFKPKQATTESLSHLLHQALQSSDDSMLELALTVRDVKIRKHSVEDLTVEQATVFLNKLTARLAKKPNRAGALVPWIQTLLLSGKIQSTDPLLPLRNLVQERTEIFPQLLQLEGRLKLLASM